MLRLLAIGSLLFTLLRPAALPAQETIPVPWANKLFIAQSPPPVLVHDFGAVPNGTIVSHRFAIQNVWAVPITIQDVRVQCGCVTATLPKKVLEPLEESVMELTMDLRKFPSQNKAVTVWVDLRQGDLYRSTATLQVRALTLGDLSVSPGSLDFGVVPQGQKQIKSVDVVYSGSFPNWQVAGVAKNDASAVSVQVQPLPRQRSGVGYRITATLKEDAFPGALQEQILLKTNDPTNPNLTVSVTGSIQAPYNVSPNPIRFEGVRVGQGKAMNILVSGSKPFKIVRIEGAGEGITAKPTNDKENKVQAIQIRYQPAEVQEGKRQLVLITETGAPIAVLIELSSVAP